ncbi:MAG TPA: ATPase, partial [Microterricola sp.]
SLGYPDLASTIRILEGTSSAQVTVNPVITPQALVGMSDLARGVFVNPLVLDYIARIVEASRTTNQLRMGVSVRGARALTKAAKTWAAAHERSYVIPDDVKLLAEHILAHRVVVDPEAEFDGVTANAVIGQILLDIVPPLRSELT